MPRSLARPERKRVTNCERHCPPPRHALEKIRKRPFGMHEWFRLKRLTQDYCLRTANAAHPAVLRVGDVFVTGEVVLAAPRKGFDNIVHVLISSGRNGCWIQIPSYLPIALLTKEDQESAPSGYVREKK